MAAKNQTRTNNSTKAKKAKEIPLAIRRRPDTILDAVNQLCEKVWYNRHIYTKDKIENGDTIAQDVWKQALKATAKLKKKYGSKNLGPWSDFEWGMINGKLSALRWVLGDDWDFLDT